MSPDALTERVLSGDPRAIARAISLVENEAPEAAALVAAIHARTGRAYLVGITGPPGAGKSSLVDRLITHLRREGRTVGVIAVDPTSPFTGGAILGDRVRMSSHAGDAGVFIRSMATRGHLGGLARAAGDAVAVLDASGKDVVFIETVGVGQGEVDVVRTADVSVVVLVPGTGDDVQAIKAGIMEIADIFVVNKMDREGADRLAAAIASSLELRAAGGDEWKPPIVRTQATSGAGIEELWSAVAQFRERAEARREARRRERSRAQLHDLLVRGLLERTERELPPGACERAVDDIVAKAVDPHTAASTLIEQAWPPRGRSREAAG